MLTKIMSALLFVGGIFSFFLGKRSGINKRNKIKIKTYEEANITRKEVKAIPDDGLNDQLDSLLKN